MKYPTNKPTAIINIDFILKLLSTYRVDSAMTRAKIAVLDCVKTINIRDTRTRAFLKLGLKNVLNEIINVRINPQKIALSLGELKVPKSLKFLDISEFNS